MKGNNYPAKYALLYSLLVATILLAPLFIYFQYMKNVYTVQNELLLKEKSLLIINAMQEYDKTKGHFEYPRFKTFTSGLYDESFKPIFSLIEDNVEHFQKGYYQYDNEAYLIINLPKGRYFDAKYLILKNSVSYAPLYEKVLSALLLIVILIFILSIFFLKNFAQPFRTINKQLDNFIKDSMHEINTPLSIINVNIDLYSRKNSVNKYLQRIKAATKVLSNIYDDMDYLIKHEQLNQDKMDIEIALFLKERVEYFDEVAKMKNIQIHTHIEDCGYIPINDKQLQRIIDNTISNAIKYSNENSQIDIELIKKDNKIHLSFQDYGTGIKNVNEIFERYYREDTNKGGFGIGLNIVQEIIKQEKIELKIDSQPRVGSTFLYIFPEN